MSVSRPSLLISRILQFRDLSPLLVFTDSALQSAYPLLLHFEEAAKRAHLKVIKIGWNRTHNDVCTLHSTSATQEGLPTSKTIDQILSEIRNLTAGRDKILLSISDLNDFLGLSASHLSTFLSSLIAISPGRISICTIYHSDIPLVAYPSHLPTPEVLLNYLGTTIIRITGSLSHVLLSREADFKSRTSPIELDLEGRDIFVPLGSNQDNIVFVVEHRRKSGRGVSEECVFNGRDRTIVASTDVPGLHPAEQRTAEATIDEEELGFKISLSEKEKVDRDGVVLPHFRAQETEAREGNIYYEPDSGDDFDQEDPDDDLVL